MTSSPVEPGTTSGRPVLRQSAVNLGALVMTAVAGVVAVAVAGEVAFAHYAQAIALTSLTHLIVTQRLEVLLLNMHGPARAEMKRYIARIAVPALVVVTAACVVAFLILGPSVRDAVLLLVPPLTAVHAITEVLSADRSARRVFTAVAANRFLVGVGLLIAIPIAAVASATAVALLIADFVARSAALAPLLRAPQQPELDNGPETREDDPDLGAFRRTYLPAAAVSALSIAAVPLLGPMIFEAATIAAFLVVFRLASAFAGAIGRAVAIISPVLIGTARASAALVTEYRHGIVRGIGGSTIAVVAGAILLTQPSLRPYGTASLAVAPWLMAVGIAQVSAAHFVARRWFGLSLRMTVADILLTAMGLAIGFAVDSMTLGLGIYGATAVFAAGLFATIARQRELR